MIDISKINNSKPYIVFKKYYELALKKNQKSIEAVCISSFNAKENEVESRFVNLKYIIGSEWVFFTNYDSQKGKNFLDHPQISAVFYWQNINVQIRMKANIYKSSSIFSDKYFLNRDSLKNALAICSNQSKKIDSYEQMCKKYKSTLEKEKKLHERPHYWGGYNFKPYYFEFWEGNVNRLNKRETFTLSTNKWIEETLQP